MAECAPRPSKDFLSPHGFRSSWRWLLPLRAPQATVVRGPQAEPLPEVAVRDKAPVDRQAQPALVELPAVPQR